MPCFYTAFLLSCCVMGPSCAVFEISTNLWITVWWHFEHSSFWNSLSALLAFLQLEYPDFRNESFTLTLFRIPWLLAFLQIVQNISLHKKWSFRLRISSVNVTKYAADLVTFAETLNGKLYFLCSDAKYTIFSFVIM